MKLKPMFFILLLVALLAAACGPAPTPTPTVVKQVEATPTLPPTATTAPTEEPNGSGDPTWDRVQSTGKIVFGTSADYKPFEYYDSSNKLTGFDIALARELGARLGLQVEFKDYAFEGLGTGLQTGNFDAAIAAISVTPDRQAKVDFTNIYFSGQDAVLARQGSDIPKITTAVQMIPYRVGVQRGTTYESYMQKYLVEPGLMPASNLLQYEMPEHAVRDLKENRNDLVFMGEIPAQEYISSGGVEIVGQSLYLQRYAIALVKGSSVLLERLNKTLTDIRRDGTLAKMALIYLRTDIAEVPLAPTPGPTLPAATAAPPPCYDNMAYVADITIPDGTYIDPGQFFNKTWRINNNGTCAWDGSYRLVFVQGYSMGGFPTAIQGAVNPGVSYDITVGMTAPTTPGTYQGWWQMVNGQNIAFGSRIYVLINVPGAPEPTSTPPPPTATVPGPTATNPPPTATLPPPTATPVPPTPTPQPTPPPKPVINSFMVTPTTVYQSQPVTITWSFSGESLAGARLTRTDPDGTIVTLNGGADVQPTGSYQDAPPYAGTVFYSLVVSSEYSGSTTASIQITVDPVAINPQ